MDVKKEALTRKSYLLDKKYWGFFVPTILMAMTLTMSIVVDSIIVGNMLGAKALAAVNLVMPVVMLYNTVAVCLGLGAATLISIAKGRQQAEYANTVFTTMLSVMLGLSLLFLVGQAFSVDAITKLLTSEPSLRPLVKSYLQVLVYGTPLIIIVPGLAYCLRVDAKVKLASTILIVSNIVNLILDLVYMGPMQLGIAGSSLATVSGYIVGAALLLVYVFDEKRTLFFKLHTLGNLKELRSITKNVITTGMPAALGSILIMLKILCVNHIILAVAGTSGMVAFSVCLSCLSFVSMFISGAAQAMTPITGVLYGENDYQGIYFVVRRAFKTLLTTSFVATILLELFPGIILQLFGVEHGADIAEGIPAIRLFSLSLMGTSITFLSMFYYMTIGQTKLSTAISCVQGASVIPLAFIISQFLGASGVWISFLLAEIITIVMILGWYFSLKTKFPQKYTNPLLLDHEQLPKRKRLEMTWSMDEQTRLRGYAEVAEFITAAKVDKKIEENAVRAIKEIADQIAKSAHVSVKRSIKFIDLIVDVYADKIVISLRDSLKVVAVDKQQQQTVKESEKCDLGFSQTIGFNTYTLTFDHK